MSASSTQIPPGYAPPYAVVTEDDHSAWLIIAMVLGLTLSLLFATFRIVVRRGDTMGGGRDDVVLALATVRITSCRVESIPCTDEYLYR